MMSTLDFIPHTLKRRKVGVEKPSSSFEDQGPSSSKPPVQTTEDTTPLAPPKSKEDKPVPKSQKKKKAKQVIKPSWDFAFLVWLALSDYSLWADGDLRRKMETSERDPDVLEEGNSMVNPMVDEDDMVVDEKVPRDEQAYVSLDHLFKNSPVFRLVSNLKPYCDAKEIAYVNSSRQFAKDLIDVRFIVDSESSSTRATVNNRRLRIPQSGYEVRRTHFASPKDSEFSRYSKSRWDGLTVYMENIPIQYANVPGLGKLITALLPASNGSPMRRILQNIVFPPHHQDLPGSVPICKGFALITLSSKDDVQALLDAWPWDSERCANRLDPMKLETSDQANNQSVEERTAKASGLRICTKTRWGELRAEYLLYRQQLVDEVNQQNEEDTRWQKNGMHEGRHKGPRAEDQAVCGSKRKQLESTAQNEAGIRSDSPFPTACLVSVRHVHPQTNKTTLRTLFSQAWGEGGNAVEYIDYLKNTNSCHVRFATPAHAERFVDYFSSHLIGQLSGLDSNGSESPEPEVKPIVAEVVLGKREELYWDKVPEKLRRQAVEKTLRALQFVGDSGGAVEEALQEGGEGGRKKRRRRGKASE